MDRGAPFFARFAGAIRSLTTKFCPVPVANQPPSGFESYSPCEPATSAPRFLSRSRCLQLRVAPRPTTWSRPLLHRRLTAAGDTAQVGAVLQIRPEATGSRSSRGRRRTPAADLAPGRERTSGLRRRRGARWGHPVSRSEPAGKVRRYGTHAVDTTCEAGKSALRCLADGTRSFASRTRHASTVARPWASGARTTGSWTRVVTASRTS